MALYDELASDYDHLFTDNISKAEDDYIAKRFLPLITKAQTENEFVVDVGCGTGWLLDHWTIAPENYIGFDVSRPMLNEAKRKHPFYAFALADMTEKWQPYCLNADLIFSLFCAANYDTVNNHIASIKRALSPRGTAVVVAHTIGFWKDKQKTEKLCIRHVDKGWQEWTPLKVNAACEKHGMKAKISYFRHANNLPAWLPVWIHKLWIKARKPYCHDALYIIVELTHDDPSTVYGFRGPLNMENGSEPAETPTSVHSPKCCE